VAGHFDGTNGVQPYCWDVVNEAIDDKHGLLMRESPWSAIVGADFMDYAFRYAREAMPGMQLFYNDYNETNIEKREKIYKTLLAMQERGVPLDGVGMQMHCRIQGPTADEVKAAIEVYAALGLRIHVTEMDVSVFAFEDKTKQDAPTAEQMKALAATYKGYFKVFREYKDVIDSVTLWGVADDTSWLNYFPVPDRKSWPLLFDENHQPKEAFYEGMDF
jgi:endo-1,4-beta-xylanase